jgi:choline dehydrogenase-like flavoprotein
MAQIVVPSIPLWGLRRVGRTRRGLAGDLRRPAARRQPILVERDGRIRPAVIAQQRGAARTARRRDEADPQEARLLGGGGALAQGKDTTHQCGTLCFGTDPRASVLDPFCRSHDIDNLFVVDASFFPSSAAVNPGLTIVAQALRVADHIRENHLT